MEAPHIQSLARLIDQMVEDRVARAAFGQRVRLSGLVENYLDALRAEGRRPRYVSDVAGSLRQALEYLGARRLDEIDQGALLRYRQALLTTGLAARTAEKKVQAVYTWVSWLVSLGVHGQPIARLRKVRVREDQLRHDRRALTREEAERYLEAHLELDRRDQQSGRRHVEQTSFYLALLTTGARWGELVAATWADVLWEDGLLRIAAAASKSRRQRWVPLSGQLLGRLRARAQGPLASPLWLGARGLGRLKHRPALRRHDAALRLAGIPRQDQGGRHLDLHALRVTAITGWLEAGLALSEAQSLAGHTDVRVTAGYARHVPGDVLQRARRVSTLYRAFTVAEAPDPASLPFEGGEAVP